MSASNSTTTTPGPATNLPGMCLPTPFIPGLGPAEFLDEGIPPKVKAAIVTGEYIEITKLDKDTYNEVAYNIKVGEVDDDISVQLAKKKEPKSKVLTFEQWSDLFHKFMYIYMTRHPHESPNLITYHYLVRSIARDGGNWQTYDKAFRKRKARMHMAWNTVCQFSYSKAFHGSPNRPDPQPGLKSKQPFRAAPRQRVPLGYCVRFHTDKDGCASNPCKWKHQCYNCEGYHKRSSCTKP